MNKIKILIEKRYKILVSLFFAVYLCVGMSIVKDYGISWDEPAARGCGGRALKYVVKGDQELLNYCDRYEGTAFQSFLVATEVILNLTDESGKYKNPRTTYLMRHLFTFQLFVFGLWLGSSNKLLPFFLKNYYCIHTASNGT